MCNFIDVLVSYVTNSCSRFKRIKGGKEENKMEVDNNTKQLQHYLKVGTEYIKKALSIDEKTSNF